MSSAAGTRLEEVADGVYAYLQPDRWGMSNAGLVAGEGASLLVDTLFDLPLTRRMLDAMASVTSGAPIRTLVNTHANGDHCYGNELVTGAEIVASEASAEEMDEVPAALLAALLDADFPEPLAGYLDRCFGDFDFAGVSGADPTRSFSGRLDLAVAGRPAHVHLKVGSGMDPRGVRWESGPGLLAELRARSDLRLSGVYTHFATAEEDLEFARLQLERLLTAVEKGGGRRGLTLHAANSAALLRLPESHLDLVRPGLAIYGCHASEGTRPSLSPVLRLTARLMQVKEVRAGESCGYGLTHVFERDTTIGLVPIGYGDGYLRALGNRSILADPRRADANRNIRARCRIDRAVSIRPRSAGPYH